MASAESIDAGDQGTIEVRAWYADNKGIAIIDNPNGDVPYTLEVLVESRQMIGWTHGYFRVIEKDFRTRHCILKIELRGEHENIHPFNVTLFMDVNANEWALQQQ